MKMHDLEVFCAVAEDESFVKAAHRLYISQSAVTQLIRKMETELGFSLLSRNTHCVKVTAQGKTFYIAAKDILQRYRQALNDCSLDSALEQTLNVFYVGPTGAPYLTNVLKHFHKLYPHCKVSTRRLRPDLVSPLLENGKANLVFTSYDLIEDRSKISFYSLYHDSHYCIMETEDPLSQKSMIKFEDLAGKLILILSRTFRPSRVQVIEEKLNSGDLDCKLEETFNIDSATIQVLTQNDTIAIVPGFCIPEHPRLHASQLEDGVSIRMGLAHLNPMTPIEERFALIAREYLTQTEKIRTDD